MAKLKKPSWMRMPALKTFQRVTGVLLVVTLGVFVGLGFSIAFQDLKITYSLAEETTNFLKAECQKYQSYTQGISARSLQSLLDDANTLKKFIPAEQLSDSDFLHEYVHTEHLGGVLVVDSNLSLVAQSDLDHQDAYALWKDVLQKETVRVMLQHPEKTYVDKVVRNDVPYDVGIVAAEDGSRLILCYASANKPSGDPYELTLRSVLVNNTFQKNPTVVITDGTQILSTNDSIVAELGSSQYELLSSTIDWKDDQLVRFRYNNTSFYGLRRVYEGYYLYAVYTSREVFADRLNLIIVAFMVYLLILLHYLFAQRYIDRRSMEKMQKQLRIISAISTSYDSTFLLHIDRMELEPIRPSARLKAAFGEHPNPYDFIFQVCRTYVAREHRNIVMDLLELRSLVERLKGKPYIGGEVKDSAGAWYSLMVIPQRFDEQGNVQAVLVTTQDVTAIKQAEELSFRDKLTGLYNRNYMEANAEQFMQNGSRPVSLIMADCNYLKRTNDTLGHEYGDLLLQRVAKSIREAMPEGSLAMRIGGDEFLLLCTRCPQEQAAGVVDAIRQKLVCRSDDTLKLSVSFGVYTAEDGSSFREAYEQADQAMYEEKKRFHQEND